MSTRAVAAMFTAVAGVVSAMWAASKPIKTEATRAVPPDTAGPNDPDLTEAPPVPPINGRGVFNHAYAGATDRDIADLFLVDDKWLRAKYARELRYARGARRCRLHRLQLTSAEKLNSSILTMLGRNNLGQSLNPAKPGIPEPEIGSTDSADEAG